MQQVYKLIFGGVLLWALPSMANAADVVDYNTTNITPAMMENADAVVRYNQLSLNLISPGKVEYHYKKATTILKESGLQKSVFYLNYDSKTMKVGSISATVYDAKGNKVKRIRTEEILDFSNIDWGTMFSNSRIKQIDPRYQTYPFTVEYEYSITVLTAFYFPKFSPFMGYNTSVEKTVFSITSPIGYNLKYKEYNNVQPCKKTVVGSTNILEWQCSNFAARNYEPYSQDYDDLFPYVNLSPSTFEYDGYEGSLESWQSFGQFIEQLNKDRDELPTATIAKIQELVKDCTTDIEKVQKIYAYAQQKNRYVSIQLGIGGFQPFPASTVDEVSYGDCKALSNYTKALLKSVGIRSVYAIIEAGENIGRMDTSFVHNTFNHAVLSVPLANDTIWLECTNPHIPCGYFGDFTHNRYALLIDGDQSRLVKTKAMTKATNTVKRMGSFTLLSDGYAKANMETQFAGIHYGNYTRFKLMDDKDRKEYIIKHITIPNFQLVNYKLTDNPKGTPYLQLNTTVDLPNYMTKSGNRLIMPINQYNPMRYIPAYARKRESPLKLVNDNVECDTIVYQLPANYKAEALPQPTTIDTQFGSYKSHCEAIEGTIVYYRYFATNDGLYKPEMYNEYRAFLEKIAAADNAKCVFVLK